MSKNSAVVEVHPSSGDTPHKPDVISPDVTMMVLTWVTFFLLLIVLQKFAWKPILAALDVREKHIKDALDEADQIKEEMARIEEKRAQLIAEAEDQSKEIIEHARKAALEAAKVIERKAKEQSDITLENARQEIKNEVDKARSDLKKQSAELAVELAGKLIEENLDDAKNRNFVNRIIKEI